MKTSISQLSVLLGRTRMQTQRALNEMNRCGLVNIVKSRNGLAIEPTEKVREILSSDFQALYKESLHILLPYRGDALLILGQVALSL